MKRCTKCLEEKPPEEFGICQTTKDGRMTRCKECNKQIVSEHYGNKNGTKDEREYLQQNLLQIITSLRSQGRSLKQIANETGLDSSSISYYLRGKRKVGMNAVRKYIQKQEAYI